MNLDQQHQWLTTEIGNLKNRTEAWAIGKVKALESIQETVRKARQEKTMTSELTGKRIA